MGRTGGRTSIFPSNFVQIVPKHPEEVTKDRDRTIAASVKAKDKRNSPTQLSKNSTAKVPEAAAVLPAAFLGPPVPAHGPPAAPMALAPWAAPAGPQLNGPPRVPWKAQSMLPRPSPRHSPTTIKPPLKYQSTWEKASRSQKLPLKLPSWTLISKWQPFQRRHLRPPALGGTPH